MAVLDLGDPWAEYLYVRDITGALANAGALTCQVTFPDLTTVQSATVTGPSPTGTYLTSMADTALTQIGRYRWYAKATGQNACAMSGAFEVRDSASCALLSLDDFKGILSWPNGDLASDEQIRDKIDVVTAVIDARIGAVIPRTVTETVEIWRDFFYTRQPIISLTSLAPVRTGGMQLSASDYQVLSNGKVIRSDGAWVSISPWNQYTAVYQAGRSSFSPLILEAARLMLSHLWETQRSDFGSPSLTGADENLQPAAAIPVMTPRMLELLSSLKQIGIA